MDSSFVFTSQVQKQFYKEGLQQNLRDGLPFLQVADVDTENAEFIYNRFGDDVSAQSTPNATYRAPYSKTYDKDTKSIDEYATVTDTVLYRDLMREGFDIVADRKDKHMFALAEAIHRHGARTTSQGAGSLLDNEVLGGGVSAGTPITMTDANPDDVSASVVQLLQENNAYSSGNPYVMMTPKQAKFFNLFAMGAGFSNADQALTNGIFGGGRIIRFSRDFAGLDAIVTNEMPRTVVLTFSGAMTAADTVAVAGVTWTAAAAPSAAGEVDVEGGAEAQIDTLVAAINNDTDYLAGAGDADSYFEVSQANRTLLDNAGVKARKLSATTMEVSSFATINADDTGSTAITAGTEIEHMLAGAYNSTSVCLPSKGMHINEKDLPSTSATKGTHGYELVTGQMHDAVVWTRMAPKIVDIYVA